MLELHVGGLALDAATGNVCRIVAKKKGWWTVQFLGEDATHSRRAKQLTPRAEEDNAAEAEEAPPEAEVLQAMLDEDDEDEAPRAGADAPPAGQRRQPRRVARGVAAVLPRPAARAELVDGIALAAVVAQPVAGQPRAAALARGRAAAPAPAPAPAAAPRRSSRGRSTAAAPAPAAAAPTRRSPRRPRAGARAGPLTGARSRGTVDPPILAGPRAGHSRGGVVRIAAAPARHADARQRPLPAESSPSPAPAPAPRRSSRAFWWTQRSPAADAPAPAPAPARGPAAPHAAAPRARGRQAGPELRAAAAARRERGPNPHLRRSPRAAPPSPPPRRRWAVRPGGGGASIPAEVRLDLVQQGGG